MPRLPVLRESPVGRRIGRVAVGSGDISRLRPVGRRTRLPLVLEGSAEHVANPKTPDGPAWAGWTAGYRRSQTSPAYDAGWAGLRRLGCWPPGEASLFQKTK